jgi:hypothetical protein
MSKTIRVTPLFKEKILDITGDKINDALWAANNTWFNDGCVPSMEDLSAATMNALSEFLEVETEILEKIHEDWVRKDL